MSAVLIPGTAAYNVTWSVTGGCAPYSGTIVANPVVGGNPSPGTLTRTYKITQPSGSLHDPLTPCCATRYTFTLHDSAGHTASATFTTLQP